MIAPSVTVLMAVHNGEPYLPQAVDSVLAQTYRDFEFLIVNDGSTDRSHEILRSYSDPRIRILKNPTNIGLTRSLNRGLEQARGGYVARQDADDVSRSERLARQVSLLEARPEIALVGSHVRIIDKRGRVRRSLGDFRPTTPLGVQWQLLFGNPFVHTATMFRRDVVWSDLGGYDERFIFNQDFELWSRLLARYNGLNLAEPLVDYRVHGASIVGRRDDEAREPRVQNVARNIEVQKRNLRRILLRGDLAERWPPLWTSMNVGWLTGPPEHPASALELVREMHGCFVALYPDAASHPDVSGTLAAVLARIACQLAPVDRISACRAYSRALQASARVAAGEIARFATMLTLGNAGLTAARCLRTLGRRP